MRPYLQNLSIILLCLGAVFSFGVQAKLISLILWGTGFLCILFTSTEFRRYGMLLYGIFFMLSLTPISTDISIPHMTLLGVILLTAVILPYALSRYVYHDDVIQFKFHHGRRWYKTEILYVLLTAALALILLPFYFSTSQAYKNWAVDLEPFALFRFFLGTNGLGLWDELFFINTVLGILRRHFRFFWANTAQAVLFTSFLYELGFRGWGPFMIFPFALLQGYIFKKTESLLYVITIHLTLDFILFFVLIYFHYPSLFFNR